MSIGLITSIVMDAIDNKDTRVKPADSISEIKKLLGLGDGMHHALNDEGFRVIGSKESIEHFKQLINGVSDD